MCKIAFKIIVQNLMLFIHAPATYACLIFFVAQFQQGAGNIPQRFWTILI